MSQFQLQLGLYEVTNRQLSYHRETALQDGLVMAKVEDWDWETIFCGHYWFIFNRCDVIGLQSYQIR